MDRTGTNEGWLTVFNRDKEKSWDEKIGWETVVIEGKTVHLLRQWTVDGGKNSLIDAFVFNIHKSQITNP
jgi:hypothetical protein